MHNKSLFSTLIGHNMLGSICVKYKLGQNEVTHKNERNPSTIRTQTLKYAMCAPGLLHTNKYSLENICIEYPEVGSYRQKKTAWNLEPSNNNRMICAHLL